ncbi:hypothetical protein OX283_004810 [Flavobacterium sp. SUN052]|uniref:hypothetical protein n=1 Tax=Flavobacterium sp. SUN052 TaxID=3002441 RepID=UPI00237E1409|nr:hypothetical protein [Flavobacterium sp. SUN052]MEC4003967.1 hypothetical protein [Flavobacterium sp. SUN052]
MSANNSKSIVNTSKINFFKLFFEYDNKAFDFFSNHYYSDLNKRLSFKMVEIYTNNASVLNTVVKIKKNKKSYEDYVDGKINNIWETLSNDVNAFNDVPHKLPKSSRALRTQIEKYLKQGYSAIIDKRLDNKNASKIKDNEQTSLIDELLAKHQNFDNKQIANVYNLICKKLGWKTITAQTIANRKEANKLVIIAGRKGTNALSNTLLMQNKRTAPTKPMLYWTMDGWDAELLYQSTTTNKKGYSITTYHNRLNVVLILDPFNKYPVGYAIGTHETPQLIKEALRNAFQHTKALFGSFFRPYQLQTDNYSISVLKPIYEACTTHYTPAKVKNAKAKIIEPYFNRFNKEYCQMFQNWSGHNVNSGSKNQPNTEYLNKIRNQFPDKEGCKQQLISAIELERAKKRDEYINQWLNVPVEYKSEMTFEMYLKVLGESTGYTNRLTGAGLITKLQGQELVYDSFDINFRKLSHNDWCIKYDSNDLSQILVINANSKNGKLINEIGTYQFILQQKHIQPMALAERSENDAKQLQNITEYNNQIIEYITNKRSENATIVENLLRQPELNDTLAKLLLVDSRGQHKDRKNESNIIQDNAKIVIKRLKKDVDKKANEHKQDSQKEIDEYNKEKIDITEYL